MPRFASCSLLTGALLWIGSTTSFAAEATPAPAPFRLMSAEKEAGLRKLLPKISDEKMTKLLDDDRLLLYTEAEMPRCHQDWDGQLPGLHTAYYNISADRGEPFGNGNREFPWGTPAGTHRTHNLYTFRFLHLPQDEAGKTLPVAYYRKHLRGDVSKGYAWIYPVGTIFGEVLCMKTSNGEAVPFEIRIRIREQRNWDVDAFRPFPTSDALAKRVKELRGDWQEKPALAKLVAHLETEQALPTKRLVDSNHPYRTIDQTMGVDSLPAIDDDKLVIELLTTTPFASAHGEIWRKGTNAVYTSAPTTAARFHVVPAGYDAGFIEVDTHSCMRCHETANQHVRNFEPGRDWYGRVRGSDGIFSWHPFDPNSVSGNGFGATPRIRGSLVNAGLVAPYNAKVHTAENYMRIRGLDE
ncbi:MAG TPA: hypothetical protein VL096_15370 [Pirellulaceae bacterium]|nr:hypothetical protein [Pirellulaceae bacterium]